MFRRSECHKGYRFLAKNDLPRQMGPAHHRLPWPGRSAVWLACVVRDDEVESSNLSAPTINLTTPYNIVSGWAILSKAEPEGKNLVDRAKAFNILPL